MLLSHIASAVLLSTFRDSAEASVTSLASSFAKSVSSSSEGPKFSWRVLLVDRITSSSGDGARSPTWVFVSHVNACKNIRTGESGSPESSASSSSRSSSSLLSSSSSLSSPLSSTMAASIKFIDVFRRSYPKIEKLNWKARQLQELPALMSLRPVVSVVRPIQHVSQIIWFHVFQLPQESQTTWNQHR